MDISSAASAATPTTAIAPAKNHYDALCVIVLFPIVLAVGAGEKRVDGLSGAQGIVPVLLVAIAAIAMAYASLKIYDVPVRRWLSKKYLQRTVREERH